jgi:hypothetical protein
MERGEFLNRLKTIPLDVVQALRLARQQRDERRYGSVAERLAAYRALYEACEAVYAEHANKIGTFTGQAGRRYQRLVLESTPDAPELILDKGLSDGGEFEIIAMRMAMGPGENPVIYDREHVVISSKRGASNITRSETHYPSDWNPLLFDDARFIDTQTKPRTLAANEAQQWADTLASGELKPVENHILMHGATYTDTDELS